MAPRTTFARAALAALSALVVVLGSAPAAAAEEGGPELEAAAWILVDGRTGEALAAHRPNRVRPIASATKLMTARLVLQGLQLDRSLPAADYDALPVESVLGLRAGEQVSVRDLLVALLLASANDAAVTLAEGVSGSVPAFVRAMNREAGRLGLDRTSFANPIGLDAPGNHSTAAELAELTRALLADRRFSAIVARPEARLRSGAADRRVVTRNSLLLSDPTVNGVKTGHTLGAGYVLVASAERDGLPLISVVLGAASESARDAESAQLLDHGFGLYERRPVLRREQEVGAVTVEGAEVAVNLVAARGVRLPLRRGQRPEVEFEAEGQARAPVQAGERLGRITVSLDGEPQVSVPALAAAAVEAEGLATGMAGAVAVALLGSGAILVSTAVLLARARRGRDRRTGRARMTEERERRLQERMQGRENGS